MPKWQEWLDEDRADNLFTRPKKTEHHHSERAKERIMRQHEEKLEAQAKHKLDKNASRHLKSHPSSE